MEAPLLVSTTWLAARLGDPTIRIADARWSLLERHKGRASYDEGHVPGAVFLDVDDDLASPRGSGPGRHPLPAPEAFAATMSRLGVGAQTHVVAYDFGDGSTAARVWWLLRWLGHDRVSLLDGGMDAWAAEGRPLEREAVPPPRAAFVARPRDGMRVDAAAIEQMRRDPRALVIDSRASERYEGRTEPVDPVAGHVPGAKSRPYPRNVDPGAHRRFLSPDALRAQFDTLGAGEAERIACYCGSGVNACQNVLALALAGRPGALLYEGSWSDWCSDPSRPVATGTEPGA